MFIIARGFDDRCCEENRCEHDGSMAKSAAPYSPNAYRTNEDSMPILRRYWMIKLVAVAVLEWTG